MPSSIIFKNKQPVHKHKKELFVLIIIGLITISTLIIYTYIINKPLFDSDLPRVNIYYEKTPDHEDYVDCNFELTSEKMEENTPIINSKIKLSGNPASWKDKVSYRLQLSQRISLLSMRKDDDWVLMGLFLDYTRMRTKMCFDLYRSLQPSNPSAILPDSEYVCLYINGEFQGLYLLAEKVDRRLFNLDDAQNNMDSSLIFQVKGFTDLRKYEQDRWVQDWPNEDEDIYIMDEILTELIEFVNNTKDDVFFSPETGVYTKFEKLNLIDFYIYNFFILHTDFWYKNYILIRNTNPDKFCFIPLDFDGSLGQIGWHLEDSNANYELFIAYAHRLFDRLINNDNFIADCKNRWGQLRENLWTDKFILDMLSDIHNDIKEILDFEMNKWKPETVEKEPDSGWPDFVIYSTKEFDLDEYLKSLFEFIPERLDFCDIYFSYDQ